MKESMNNLDRQLADALRREEPPAGFAERVINRVAEKPRDAQGRSRPGPFGPGLKADQRIRLKPDPTLAARVIKVSFAQWAAAAALVAAVAGGFDYVAKQKERADGEAAKDRVVLALHIAGTKLQLVQTKINELNERQ